MPRQPRIHPDAQLLTFAEAAVVLGVGRPDILELIRNKQLRAHPILADRIARHELERFVQYGTRETDSPQRRPMDAPASQKPWGVPPLRVRP